MKKVLRTLLVLGLLGAAGFFGYRYYQGLQTPVVEAGATAYQQVAVTTGALSKSVTGTGALSIGETQEVALEYGVTVAGTLARVGDLVEPGSPLLALDREALETTIDTLQTELDTAESEMASLSEGYSSAVTVKAPLAGRVKEVYVQAGQRLEAVMAEKGSIALLSLDGKMYAQIPAPEGMAVTDSVTVKVGRTSLDGVVRALEDGVARITFSDAYAREGQEVEVLYRQASLGTAQARISMPYSLTSTEKGYVSVVYMEENQKKWQGNRLLYLINVPVPAQYTALESSRAKLTAQIAQAKEMLASGTVTSPIDGVVSTLAEASPVQAEAKTALASLYVGDQKQMVVTVDELDILNVQVGQQVSVSFDALEGVAYQGEVAHVSHIGAASSGVTTYDVTIAIQGDENLKIGMNGTAVILVQQVQDALLVPLAALSTSREGQYVWVYDPTLPSDSDEPGIKTFVTTGMSDENYAQVLTGLAEGDVVLLTREAGSGSGNSRFLNMGGNMMFDMGGGGMALPSGGTPPSGGGFGGGTRPGGSR